MKRCLAAVLAMIFVAGCNCGEKRATKDEPARQGKQAEATDDSPAVAWAAGKTITQNDFEAELNRLPPAQRDWGNSSQGRKYILDTYIDAMLIDAESEKRGFSDRPDVAAKLQNYRRQILKDTMMEDILKTGPVTDAEARNYYDGRPEEFRQPERVKIFDMVVRDEGTARKVMAGLMKGGSFEKAAGELSIDSFTKARGGDIPEFSREMRPDLFDAASRAKKPGEIIGPFRSQDGIHVIRFIKKIPAEERKFEDVKENLKGRIIAQKRQAAYSEFLRNLRETAGVRLDNSFIEDGAKAARPQPAQGGSQPAPPKGR